ncbi:MAG: hypothetical protein PHW82_12890 [Bacteroidales bacterium]|nr:hypothetical protein [Bacteroidales bacterium]
MGKKQLILTFDYELFLGKKSGSVINCLIKPTDLLLNILSKHKQSAIFFIDTTYLWSLNEVAKSYPVAKYDYESILAQLKEMVNKGHIIAHHIHPHWFDAQYLPEINQWDLSNVEKLTFEKIDNNERESLFSFSNAIILDIYKQANIEVETHAFRAGGLFIEPFSEFAPFFENYNIKYDFSVLPGGKRDDNINRFDFSNSPSNRIYQFSETIATENKKGKFTEFPISLIEIKNFNKFTNGIYYRLMKNKSKMQPYGDGTSIANVINSANSEDAKPNYLSMQIPASVEILNPTLLNLYKNYLKSSDYFQILSHPKLLTPMSLKQLDMFLSYVNKKFNLLLLSEIFRTATKEHN